MTAAVARLCRKDWRVYRAAVFAALAVLVLPYALAAAAMLLQGGVKSALLGVLLRSTRGGLALTFLAAAVFGGLAFAAERRDRSAGFLAMLPVPRWQVIASKLGVAAACLLTLWGVYAAAIYYDLLQIRTLYPGYVQADTPAFNALWNAAAAAVMAFGVASLLSSAMVSPAIAASVSIAVTMVSMELAIKSAAATLQSGDIASLVEFFRGARRDAIMEGRASVSAQGAVRLVLWVIGVAAWGTGTFVFVRRVRP